MHFVRKVLRKGQYSQMAKSTNMYVMYNSLLSYPALHGKRLSYRHLVSRGGFVYPGPGVKHASFKRQESIPQIRFPPAFLLAARGTMQSGMFVYKCGPGKCMTHVNYHMHGSHPI